MPSGIRPGPRAGGCCTRHGRRRRRRRRSNGGPRRRRRRRRSGRVFSSLCYRRQTRDCRAQVFVTRDVIVQGYVPSCDTIAVIDSRRLRTMLSSAPVVTDVDNASQLNPCRLPSLQLQSLIRLGSREIAERDAVRLGRQLTQPPLLAPDPPRR